MAELIKTKNQRFDMTTFTNRRFMYNPKTGTLVLGKDNDSRNSHAVEFYETGCCEDFDEFIRGWVGNGKSYPYGIIHFAPNIPKECVYLYDKAFTVLEMFKKNGMLNETIVRGFGAVWERPAKELI